MRALAATAPDGPHGPWGATPAPAIVAAATPPVGAVPASEADSLPSIEAFLADEPVGTDAPTIDAAAEFGADWTLEQAAPELEALGQALAPRTARPTPAQQRAVSDGERFGIDPALAAPAGPAPLPAWRDDEFVEILPPIAASPRTTPIDQLAVGDPAARAAAAVLEGIAQRVRRGELALPGYAPGMGDAAALAATLTALLASRQR